MDNNKDSTQNKETNWLSRSTLKDWQVIVGFIVLLGGGWWNLATSTAKSDANVSVLTKEIIELKTLYKENLGKDEQRYNNLDKRTNDNTVQIEVLKVRVDQRNR